MVSYFSFSRCFIQCPEQVVNHLIKKVTAKHTQDILAQGSVALQVPFYFAQFHLYGIISACLTHTKRLLLRKKNITGEVNIKWSSSENLFEQPFVIASYDSITLYADLSPLLLYQYTHKEAREKKTSNVPICHHYFYCMFSFLFLKRYST